MKKYFYLQQKRVLKAFPFFLAVTLVLLLGTAIIFSGIMNIFNNREENKRFEIAITGDTDNTYLDWGMAAMRTFDETRFAIEFIEMTEADAQKALENGGISAYVVLPDDFVENAVMGQVDPVKYVTTPGVSGIVSMFKNEVTQIVTDMVVYSQKGTYGIGDAMTDNGLAYAADDAVYEISIEYVDLIFHRSELYTMEELGIVSGLSMTEYYVCGISILLLMLIGLPYVAVYVKRDYSLNSLLVSRGHSAVRQLLCEYAAHLTSLLMLVGVILAVVGTGAVFMREAIGGLLKAEVIFGFALRLIPVLLMLAAFNIMVFEIADNIVSGVLMHFFVSIGLCYVSGCMYPIYAFPKILQHIAAFLPTGLARTCLAGAFTDAASSLWGVLGVLVYAVIFVGIAFAARTYKTANERG